MQTSTEQAPIDTAIVRQLADGIVPVELAGGKAASLTSMATAGLPVPAGFVLTTEAYRLAVSANSLQTGIDAATRDLSDADPASWGRASATIETLFERATVPDQIAAALRDAYATLAAPSSDAGLGDRPAVAVRSSATAEDLPGASFAGQQETFLNVRGADALLDAVRRCWASLWTARALQYRHRLGIDPQTVAMGVVVQVMVPSETSGVLFTANPATGERTEMLVNASFGLGEAIVSGHVTPDTYTLDKATLTVKATVLGSKETVIVADVDAGQGTRAEPVPDAQRGTQALPASRLRDLADLALQVEAHFQGVPQDIEWAVADGRVWLLQARPITGLPPAPLHDVRWEPPIPGSGWIRRQVVEHMPEPLSPLFDELYLREGLERSVDAILPVMDIPDLLDKIIERPLFTTVNGFAYMRADVKMAGLGLLRATLRGVPRLFKTAIPNWRDRSLPAYLASVEQWKRHDPASLSDEQILAAVRALAYADAVYWYAAALAIGVAKVTDSLLDSFLGVAARGRHLTSGRFLSGLSKTALASEAELDRLADRIRGSERLRALVAATTASDLPAALAAEPEGRTVLDGLRAYLDRHGHQIYSLDFAVPTLADDPLPVLLSLKALSQRPSGEVQARRVRLHNEQVALTRATARSFDPFRKRLFRTVLGWARRYAPYREEALFYVGAAWPTLRRLALEFGRRLVEAGSLDQPDDVFFLETSELAAASAARVAGDARPDLATLARDRRALREARTRLHAPPAVPPAYRFKLGPIDLSSRESLRRNADDATTLSGFAVSPGLVTAPASVILSPAEFATMQPGSILVCPTTTPAWTPLFAQARGLVTDIGGILAHGSIVAREYGIPAVMGTGTATQRIVSGQQVTVDGDAGTVTLGK
jgi:phosphohistidine swiveling domain-containing protein